VVVGSRIRAAHHRLWLRLRFVVGTRTVILGGIRIVIGCICIGATQHVLRSITVIVIPAETPGKG